MQSASTEAAALKPGLEVWWLHPAWLVALMGVVLIPASYLIPDWMYREYWRMPKHIDGNVTAICLFCVAAFAVGAFAGSTQPHKPAAEKRYAWTHGLPWPLLLQVFNVSFYLTLIGYVVWAGSALMRGLTPSLILGVLHGDKGVADLVKDEYMVTISGVTTLTQFGHVVIVLGGMIGAVYGWRHVRTYLGLTFFLAFARALVNSERLAVIELAIPFAVVLIRLLILDSPKMVGLIRLLVLAAPVYAGGLLLGLFAASEYFRSWLNYYAGGKLSFVEFVSLRLLGYYVTAINNGALLIQRIDPTGAPFFTAHFLWRFPVLSNIVKSIYPDIPFGLGDDPYMTIIGVSANPEFNNGDGYLLPIVDFGLPGALLYWLMMGLACGWLYRLFCRKHPLGLTLYPLLFIGIAEMPRVIYFGEGRVIPGYVVLALVSYLCVRSRALSNELQMNGLRTLGGAASA